MTTPHQKAIEAATSAAIIADNPVEEAIAAYLSSACKSAGRTFAPPFENYHETDIGDQDGHVCTAENPEIAATLVFLLNLIYSPLTPRSQS
jgi:hypothetical protein